VNRIPIYPIAAVLLLPLHLWATSGVSPLAAVRAVALTAIIVLGVVVVCRVVLRDTHLAGVAALVVCLVTLIGERQPLVAAALATGSILGWLVVTRRGFRDWAWTGRQLRRATTVAAIAVLLEALALGRIGDAGVALRPESAGGGTPRASATAEARDVYVILLDGYPRHDALVETFGIDDSPFIDGLVARGFEVSAASRSNYQATIPSLISFLNFRHLPDVPDVAREIPVSDNELPAAAHRAILDAAVLDEFSSRGYETVALASGFEDSALRSADRFLDGGQINNFEVALVRSTILASAVSAVDPDYFSALQRERIEWEFAALERLASEASARPRFIFAHIPAPHRPWVFDADGGPAREADLETWYFGPDYFDGRNAAELKARFRGQIQHIGSRALRAVDAILAAAHDRPPVILVLSDHGAALTSSPASAEGLLRNLFAARTPDRAGLFPPDATLVNVFPTLFDAYLGVELPRAEEASYIAGPHGLFDPVRSDP
jgi:hypothetical protein